MNRKAPSGTPLRHVKARLKALIARVVRGSVSLCSAGSHGSGPQAARIQKFVKARTARRVGARLGARGWHWCPTGILISWISSVPPPQTCPGLRLRSPRWWSSCSFGRSNVAAGVRGRGRSGSPRFRSAMAPAARTVPSWCCPSTAAGARWLSSRLRIGTRDETSSGFPLASPDSIDRAGSVFSRSGCRARRCGADRAHRVRRSCVGMR